MVRIAISGTHGVGKSTLVEDFLAARPGYDPVPEPYWQLTEDGVALPEAPTLDSFEQQLLASIRAIREVGAGSDIIFDRCPLDFVAYLEVLAEAEGGEWSPTGQLLGQIEAALKLLDLVVLVPLTAPDEIRARIERPALRRAVDARLKQMIREDTLGLMAPVRRVIEVTGSREARLAELLLATAS